MGGDEEKVLEVLRDFGAEFEVYRCMLENQRAIRKTTYTMMNKL